MMDSYGKASKMRNPDDLQCLFKKTLIKIHPVAQLGGKIQTVKFNLSPSKVSKASLERKG